jgi:hypothetical protein
MYPAEQVAKSNGLELKEEALFLDLKGHGHFFTLTIDSTGVLADGIPLEVSFWPVRYKHQRYYLDSDLVDVVIEGVLNPKRPVVFMGTPPPEFRIQNIYLQEHLPLQGSDLRRAVTQKLIDAALKLDPSLFKYEAESLFDSRGVVINLKCEQRDDLAEGCQISTKLGNEFHSSSTPGETADVMVNKMAEWERAKLANAFQILFARTIVANFSKAKVTASLAVESLPHPTNNPSLLVHIVLPNSMDLTLVR